MDWGKKLLIGLAGTLALPTPLLAAQARTASALQQRQSAPRPAIWLLSDADPRIYLFGTVHILHPQLRWRSAMFDRIAREAQELALEVTDEDMSAASDTEGAGAQLATPVPVLDRVSPARREGLAALMRELQLPEGSLDRLETWAVSVNLTVLWMAHDYTGGQSEVPGVEEALTREFRANGRPVLGVETAADQLAAFRTMPQAVQQAMLDETVDAYINGEQAGDAGEEDWIAGNVDGIAAEQDDFPPELFESLIVRRNRNFAGWLVRRLERPGTVLFAIGASHLAGRASVQSMLESRG